MAIIIIILHKLLEEMIKSFENQLQRLDDKNIILVFYEAQAAIKLLIKIYYKATVYYIIRDVYVPTTKFTRS